MKLTKHKLLAYNVLAMIKLIVLIMLFFGGLLLMVSEPTRDSLDILILMKTVGAGSLYVVYTILNGSSNKLKD